ncbi:MAG: hypothetical protein L0H93_15085, partial [Nocardioides sp.]|nr:hypothetical protein [Nocardioides sp.]
STAIPDSVEYATAVLGSFPGHVLIAPGPLDWLGDGGPYERGAWPANVHIWTDVGFEPAPMMPSVWGSAWTSPYSRAPRPPKDGLEGGPRILVRAGLSEGDLGGLAAGDRVVGSGGAENLEMHVVTDLVHGPGAPGGSALLVNVQDAGDGAEVLGLPGQPGSLVDLDVTTLEIQEEFEAVVNSACSHEGPVLLRLSGELPSQILLPGFGGSDLAPDVLVDASALSYASEVPEASDRSTRAEFIRAMALTRGDERERHQTTALGLKALSASTTGS